MKSALLTCLWLLAAYTLAAQLPVNCVAYYPFNGNYKDSTGNGPTGTNHGSRFTTDRNGLSKKVAAFNATYIENIDLGSPYSYSSVTVTAWMNPTYTGNAVVFLSSLANITQQKKYCDGIAADFGWENRCALR